MKRSAAIATNAAPVRRCAIYTRKSTVADVEQTFNSLQAQREACESYVAAQRSSGWQPIDVHYDDNGFSGSNTDRPAFARLLTDIDAGKIDTVVVYKVDRLSRSLLDFATLMDRFSKASVDFVSVTQNFSTADAIGRLTLNMLMSFAEFEREMIGERTRDKCAAARRKGRWTGGPVSLGYQTVEKKLVVDELEAVVVREIFDAYLHRRSALAVVGALNAQGRLTKRHRAESGRIREARPWTKSDVLRVLKNPLYAGYVSYGAERHEGEHAGIVDREVFECAQVLLREAAGACTAHGRNPDYILRSVLFCTGCGAGFTPASTRRGDREFRYYRCLTRDRRGRAACASKPLPAGAIEEYVAEQIRQATVAGNLAGDVALAVADRVAARREALRAERRVLPGEIASLGAEGKRLAELIGAAAGRARGLLEERLEEVATQMAGHESRLGDVEGEIASIDAAEVEAGWIAECLRDFDAVWDVLTSENRGRLVRAVVERVEVDEAADRIQILFADISAGTLAGDDAERTRAQEVA